MHKARALYVAIATVLFVACASTNAHFEAPVPEQYAHLPLAGRDGVSTPEPVQRVDPRAPDHLVAAGDDRVAVVEAVIGTDGRVIDAYFIRGDREWASAVAQAVMQWRFNPATRNSQPVVARFRITTKFRSVRPW